MTPATLRGPLGDTIPNEALQHHQAFGVEFFITFVLLFTVFASTDSQRSDLGGSIPLTVGLSVTVCHLWAVSRFDVFVLVGEVNNSPSKLDVFHYSKDKFPYVSNRADFETYFCRS